MPFLSTNSVAVVWLGNMVHIFGNLLMFQTILCDADDYQNTTAPSEENMSSAIEEKVLGPLRIWHIVFIVSLFLLIAMVAVFCCVDIRIPRSRQEIEANYQKRLMNLKYVRMLEKAPEELLRTEFPKPEVSVISSKETKVPNKGRQLQAHTSGATRGGGNKTSAATSSSSSNQDANGTSRGPGLSLLGSRIAKMAGGGGGGGGGPQPLAINPKDILAIMAQQRKAKSDD